ncbi:MAG: PilN domain-containing protein [Gallionella sp.]|jgi:Tfp pilus assembly protein PilN
MVQLRLDYQRGIQPFPWAGAVLLVSALTVLTLVGVYYRELAAKTVSWEAKVRKTATQDQRLTGPQTSQRGTTNTALTALEIKHANEVLQQLTLPWGKLFQAIESSSDKQVALLAMDPDAEKHVVKISGEAKNIAAVLDYIKRLAAQEVFSSVYLQSHQIQQLDPEKPVRFVLLAAWKVSP